jgi:hypothetical protein
MKKIGLLVLALVLIASSAAFAKSAGFGIGIEGSIDALGGLPSQALLTMKFQQLPFVIGIGTTIGENTFNLGMTLDWWLYHAHLVGILDIYIGPGLFLGLTPDFTLGGRVPIGLQIWPIGQVLELFLEVAPAMVFIGAPGITIPNLHLQAGFGFRFWF